MKSLARVSLITFALLAVPCLAQDDIGCYVQGECLRSLILKEDPAEDPFQCLEECQLYEDGGGASCEYFTYFADSGVSE